MVSGRLADKRDTDALGGEGDEEIHVTGLGGDLGGESGGACCIVQHGPLPAALGHCDPWLIAQLRERDRGPSSEWVISVDDDGHRLGRDYPRMQAARGFLPAAEANERDI
jgi:hypothetical protein